MKRQRSSRGEIALFLAGPVAWAAHFFLLYGAESFAPIGAVAQIAATALALAALALLVLSQFKALKSAPEDRVFLRRGAIALAALSALGILWTTLPVLLAS